MPTVRGLSSSHEISTRPPTRRSAPDAIVADVSLSATSAATAAAAALGPIDAVVHAAGVTGLAAPMTDFDEAEFDRVMAVNARGAFLGMKYALPHMADRGAIVNVASVSGIAGYPMVAAYVESNHAVIGLTRTAALEGAPRGIRVNAVCPGPIEGRLMSSATAGAAHEPEQDPFLRGVPLARYGSPDEVAETVAFLLSPATGFISGATAPSKSVGQRPAYGAAEASGRTAALVSLCAGAEAEPFVSVGTCFVAHMEDRLSRGMG